MKNFLLVVLALSLICTGTLFAAQSVDSSEPAPAPEVSAPAEAPQVDASPLMETVVEPSKNNVDACCLADCHTELNACRATCAPYDTVCWNECHNEFLSCKNSCN